jgi:predicted MFS family arabinose efflux permease
MRANTFEKANPVVFFLIIMTLYMGMASAGPYLPNHYADLGLDAAQIGLLQALSPLCTIFILPVWSRISDATGNRRGVLRTISLGMCLFVLLFLVSKSFWQLLLSALFFLSFQSSFGPLNDAIVIPALAHTKVKFSKVRMGGTLGYMFTMLYSGALFHYNKTFSFLLASLFYLILFFLVRKMPQTAPEKKERRKVDLRPLLRKKRLIFILCFTFLMQVALSFHQSFVGLFINELGYTSTETGIGFFIAGIGEIPVLLLIDRVLRRVSAPAVCIFSGIMVALRLLFMQSAQSIGVVYLAQLTNGLTFMTMYYSSALFIDSEMEEDTKSTGQSLLALFQMGFGSIVGNILGGTVAQHAGIRATYLYYGIVVGVISVLCAAVLFIQTVRKKRSYSLNT